MRRIAYFSYGLACYLMFLGVFAYAIGFIGDFAVGKTLDSERQGPFLTALVVNGLLLGLFAIQHSVMARPSFKRRWTRFVPQPIERSTYVLFSNLAMIILFYFWQPLGGDIWRVENAVAATILYAMYTLGIVTVLYATLLLNHFDLFGLRQVTCYLKGEPCTDIPFHEPSLYRYVRHPLYVGWLMVVWFTPTMTLSHLFFAVGATTYILVAIQFEERNLADSLPGYSEYRKRVPMLVPGLPANTPTASESRVETLPA